MFKIITNEFGWMLLAAVCCAVIGNIVVARIILFVLGKGWLWRQKLENNNMKGG